MMNLILKCYHYMIKFYKNKPSGPIILPNFGGVVGVPTIIIPNKDAADKKEEDAKPK